MNIETRYNQLPMNDECERALSNRRVFFRKLILLGGVSSAALFSMRAGGVGAALKKNTHERVSVKDFGALGNAVADDTASIQAAINTSNLVYLPVGIYKCTSALVVSKSNFKMYGDGELHFVRDFIGGGIIITNHIANIVLDGFTIKLLSNVDGKAFCGVFSVPNKASVVASQFTNLKIYGAAFGINIEGGEKAVHTPSEVGGKVFASTLDRSKPYMESALDSRNTLSGNVIKNSLFSVRIGSGAAHGIYVRGSGYNTVSNNQIEKMQGGILAASQGLVSYNNILNCYEDNGIYCPGSSNLSVIGNLIENTKADGIAFNHSVNCSARGNQVRGAGNASIRIQGGHNIVISGNVCNSKAVSASYVRGFIDSGSPDAPHNILIENNMFSGGVTRGTPFAFGSVPLGSAYKHWRIIGNHINGVDTSALSGSFFGPYAIVMFGSHAGNSNLIVEGNTIVGVKRCPVNPEGCQFIRNATRETGNVIKYVDQ